MLEIINSLTRVVPEEQKDQAVKFIEYFEGQFLGNHALSYRNFNHFSSIKSGFYDTTNNSVETINHQINCKIPRGHQTINSISGIIHEVKTESLGQLTASMMDETNMTLHKPEYLRRRELVTENILRFDILNKETQKIRLIRLVSFMLDKQKVLNYRIALIEV